MTYKHEIHAEIKGIINLGKCIIIQIKIVILHLFVHNRDIYFQGISFKHEWFGIPISYNGNFSLLDVPETELHVWMRIMLDLRFSCMVFSCLYKSLGLLSMRSCRPRWSSG
jgi:hypothetical protein